MRRRESLLVLRGARARVCAIINAVACDVKRINVVPLLRLDELLCHESAVGVFTISRRRVEVQHRPGARSPGDTCTRCRWSSTGSRTSIVFFESGGKNDRNAIRFFPT